MIKYTVYMNEICSHMKILNLRIKIIVNQQTVNCVANGE